MRRARGDAAGVNGGNDDDPSIRGARRRADYAPGRTRGPRPIERRHKQQVQELQVASVALRAGVRLDTLE